MSRLKVMTIAGTRPEIIRLSEVMKACDRYFNHILVHTGQNWDYTLNQVFFDELGLRTPDHYLNAVGEHLGETVGNIIAKSYEIMLTERPDALLVLGDTNSAISTYSAKRLKIPIFHMEAGNRCFDQNVPEEINRKIVDHISDINLAYTEHSRRYLISEGIRKEHIFVTGSPMTEVLHKHLGAIQSSRILENLGLEPNRYIVVSAHREENIDDERTFKLLMNSINFIAETYDMPVVYSTHPRTWKRIEERGFQFHSKVQQLKPFGFFDYNHLQMKSFCVLSDSGTLSEESSILDFTGILIRTSTERPEVLDKGTVIVGGISQRDIVQSIELASSMRLNQEAGTRAIDYTDTNVSVKVVKLIQSYVPIINRVIWNKPLIEAL